MEVEDQAGVDVTRACAHHDTRKRGKANTGIHGLASLHRSHGHAVSQVTDDHLEFADRPAQHLGAALAHVAAGGAMKAILADFVLEIEGIGQSIDVGLGRHRLVKRRIKYGHVGHFG